MKKIIISALILFFICFNVYWFDWKISIDKDSVNINDPLTLNISITSTWNTNIKIKEIKWLEKFDILSKSESQSSSISSININWETKNETKTNYSINMVLQAHEKWDFEIWPAIIEENWKNISTNSIKIKVYWEKMKMLSPNIPNINNNTNWIHNDLDKIFDNIFEELKPNYQKEVKEFDNLDNVDKPKNRDYILYFLAVFLALLIISIIYILKKDNEKLLEKVKKLESKLNKEEEKEKNNQIENQIYPEVDDENFKEKIEKILRVKMENIINTKIENKTYTEILSNYDFKEKTEIIENIIMLINKLKYSKDFVDKNEIIELVKKL